MAHTLETKHCAEGAPKFAHLCEIDMRTKPGTASWYARNNTGARRVDAIRTLHEVTGSHAGAHAELVSRTAHSSIRNAQTRTIIRVVNEILAE